MDGILRASKKCCRSIHKILSDTMSAFTDQPRLYYRKHCSLQHQPCFRVMINLEPRIRRPRYYSSCANGNPVAHTANSKHNAPLSARVWHFSELLRLPFHSLLDFDLRETCFCRPPWCILFFGTLQYRPFWTTSTRFDLWETSVTTFKFSLAIYLS